MYGYFFFYICFTKGSLAPMKCIYYQLKPVIYCRTIYCETYIYFTQSFYIWIINSCRSKNWPKSVVKETFVNQFLQGLFRNSENSPKCFNNRIFTKSFRQEKCLKKLPNELRVIYCICEQDLYIGNIICGDEHHYIMECHTFSLVRNN